MSPVFPLLCLIATAAPSIPGCEASTAEITVRSDKPGQAIPADFLGLSYEKSALAENHFRPENGILARLHRNLGNAVLRIGGNMVEHCSWQPTRAGSGETGGITPITPEEVDRFFAFTREIGWNVIYGVNLAGNNPANSAAEIGYASRTGGKSVLAFEIGNEPDHYYLPPKKTFRQQGYSYAQYRNELGEALRLIGDADPGIPLAAPANTSGGNKGWFAPCVREFGKQLSLATSHFYPTSNMEPYPTVEKLLAPETESKTVEMARANLAVAREAGLPWRLAECNSTSLGGTHGVSDVYASAVWGADFLFDLAELGVAGINFHTNFKPEGYTPIAFDRKGGTYTARPLYYSLLLFKDAGRGKVLPTETKSGANVTSHATLGADGKLRVTVINKDLTRNVTASIATGTNRSSGTVARLTGASPSRQEGITYAGMTVTPEGSLTAPKAEPIKGSSGRFEVTLPSCSAAVLTIDPG